jgi:hypothetical protein
MWCKRHSGTAFPLLLGVDDGFRISSDSKHNQEDQALRSADHGKTRQKIRKSATKRNQDL